MSNNLLPQGACSHFSPSSSRSSSWDPPAPAAREKLAPPPPSRPDALPSSPHTAVAPSSLSLLAPLSTSTQAWLLASLTQGHWFPFQGSPSPGWSGLPCPPPGRCPSPQHKSAALWNTGAPSLCQGQNQWCVGLVTKEKSKWVYIMLSTYLGEAGPGENSEMSHSRYNTHKHPLRLASAEYKASNCWELNPRRLVV